MIAALALAASAASPQFTTRQMESLSRAQVDAAARRDLLSILRPVYPPRRGMFRRLRGVTFPTRNYATAYRGVCGRDTLTLWYAVRADRPNDPNAPLKPYSVTAGSAFHIDRVADLTAAREQPGRTEGAATCSVAEGKPGWFAAPTADAAVAGARALAAALDAIARKQVRVDCDSERDCTAAVIAAARPAMIDTVEKCDAPSGRACWRLSFDAASDELTIITAASTPDVIVSVRWEEFVVVT